MNNILQEKKEHVKLMEEMAFKSKLSVGKDLKTPYKTLLENIENTIHNELKIQSVVIVDGQEYKDSLKREAELLRQKRVLLDIYKELTN